MYEKWLRDCLLEPNSNIEWMYIIVYVFDYQILNPANIIDRGELCISGLTYAALEARGIQNSGSYVKIDFIWMFVA